jgi:serine/threonine protein kinase
MCRSTTTARNQRRVSIVEESSHSYYMDIQKTALHIQQRQTTASTSASSVASHRSSRTITSTNHKSSSIHDDYSISSSVLGSGHYGTVRKCVHRQTRKSFAVKSIDKSKIGRPDHLKREVQLLSSIDHSNIMKMVDCYEDCDFVHIVTEQYTGGELFDKIIDNTTKDGCLSEAKAAKIIKSLLESVAYLHEHDIVHRDIKPENILFDSKGEDSDIRLIDFGLSRRHENGEAPMSNPVGTSYYMSPELLKGRYDRATDLWSVGVIAYIVLCGYPPMNGNDDREIFEAIRKGHYSFPSEGWSNKSDEAMDFIKCLLRRDPRKRFTAQEALMHPWLKQSINVVASCGSRRRLSLLRRNRVGMA